MAVSHLLPAGALTTPAEAGAVSMAVCRLSGMRATATCPQLTEWFVPGTEPRAADDWEREGRVTLPEEYAAWAGQGLGVAADGVSLASVREGTQPAFAAAARHAARADSARARAEARFHLSSPMNGDRYAIPSGVEGRYATIPLRGSGASGRLRWFVDGAPFDGTRWPLRVGRHQFRAETTSGEIAAAEVIVER
jgi:membrane carboxypeptidase/penicillin-binding protein PbpC